MNQFVKNALAIMEANNVTHAALAERSGIPRPNITRILNGNEGVTIDRAERIAKALGRSMQEMFSKKILEYA